MKKIQATLILIFALTATSAMAAKTYQVTGPIVDMDDKTITMMKGKEKWEIERGPSTKIEGEAKKGAKATVYYRMTAETVEVKGDVKAAKKK